MPQRSHDFDVVTLKDIRVLLISLHTRFDGMEARIEKFDERLRNLESRDAAQQVVDLGRSQSYQAMRAHLDALLEHKNRIIGGAFMLMFISALIGGSAAVMWDAFVLWMRAQVK